MFLSDELIEIGRKSNPRNNLSMWQAADEMIKLCGEREKNQNPKQVDNAFLFALKQLAIEGYPIFKMLVPTKNINSGT